MNLSAWEPETKDLITRLRKARSEFKKAANAEDRRDYVIEGRKNVINASRGRKRKKKVSPGYETPDVSSGS